MLDDDDSAEPVFWVWIAFFAVGAFAGALIGASTGWIYGLEIGAGVGALVGGAAAYAVAKLFSYALRHILYIAPVILLAAGAYWLYSQVS